MKNFIRGLIIAALWATPVFAQQVNIAGGSQAGVMRVTLIGVNFNSANTDNAINIVLPPGTSRITNAAIRINGASGTLTTATFGLFSSTGGGGTALISGGTAITVNTSSENTNNNNQTAAAGAATISYNFTTVYFRIGTAQGTAATANVTLVYNPI